MDKEDNIEFKELKLDDLDFDVLKNFNRYQETTCVRFMDNAEYKTKGDYFIDEWDEEKKIEVIKDLRNCITSGGIVIGAIREGQLIGFVNVEGKFFGSNNEYLELTYIHVSNEYRGMGIGQELFKECTIKVKEKGAKKLYIGAHPAEETQAFYRSMGCKLATEINQEIYDREPLDIQLEYVL